tara:strand:+ start:88 stop:363 length:276 start_codon:yes stop_codon:yes gene_type:complete
MKSLTMATLAAVSLVGSGIAIGFKFQKTEESANAPSLFETLNNQPLVLNPGNEGCMITNEDGQPVLIKADPGEKLMIPKGTRFTGRCLSFK